MTNFKTLKQYTFGDTILHYLINDAQVVEWMVYPKDMANQVVLRQNQNSGFSLIQAKLVQDPYDKNFSNGLTMFNSATSRSIRFVKQEEHFSKDEEKITTICRDSHGNTYRHDVSWVPGSKRLKVRVSFTNTSGHDQQLSWLPSIVLSNISPFYEQVPTGVLDLIRIRSKWAMEGRLDQRPVESFELEESWKPSGLALVQIAQYGTMPVRQFFPYLGLKDNRFDVTWLIMLEGKASWQLNAARLDNRLVLFGGLPDADNGHWYKDVAVGETYTTPFAYITVGHDELLKCSRRLQAPVQEDTLPIFYNEWGTTWGRPNAHLISESLPLLKQHSIDGYIIDAGWYKSKTSDWEQSHGDWQVDMMRFPGGFKPVVEEIHQQGMEAGLWFEMETVGRLSEKFQDTESLVQRNGHVVTTLKRRFLNMTNSNVQAYLNRHVLELLRQNAFDYLKIDYNDSMGVATDDAESGAEGLEKNISATLKFIDKLHHEIPGLVIENCSSGGHRLTPAFIERTELSSFSDAHETHSIPIIAANEWLVIPASKNLIWCVLHADDTLEEMYFHLISTFLGRVCLSGDIRHLSTDQWHAVDQALTFYRANQRLIAHGQPFRFGSSILSYRNPQGYQVCGFTDKETLDESGRLLLIVFGFNLSNSEDVDLRLSSHEWQGQDIVGAKKIGLQSDKTNWHGSIPANCYTAKAITFVRKREIEHFPA